MNKRIIYNNDVGGVSVVVPAPDAGMSIEEIAEQVVPSGVQFEIVEAGEIPTDRTFRNAWERSGKAIVHNMNKAREIAHGKRRKARTAEFAPLDVEATIPSEAAKAEAKRQAVRNKYEAMQTAIDAAEDVSGLKVALGIDVG